MYRITKEFHFSASHILSGLPDGHPCGRLHGHNYIVEVVLEADEVNEIGFVRDFGELRPVKDFLDQFWDHRHLNEAVGMDGLNPTAEVMAWVLFDRFIEFLPELAAVRVSETPKTWSEYRP